MATTYEDLVKCGYLEMKLPRKQRKMTQKVWKRKWFVLRRKSKFGLTRLEYYHSEKACYEKKPKTVIPLEGVHNIDYVHSRTHEYAFQIAAPDIKIFLSGDNSLYTNEWIRLMKELVLPETKMFPSVEGGDIFGLYEVSVISTEDSERLGLSGDYLITVRKEYLCLHSAKTGTRTIQWELAHIPKFRLQRFSQLQDKDKILIIKAGKGCKNGEGEFHFLSRQGREILDCIKCQTQRLYTSRLNPQTHINGRPSIDSVPLTRSSGTETGDSITSASCYDTESRERSISTSSHPSSKSGQNSSSSPQSPGQQENNDVTQPLPRRTKINHRTHRKPFKERASNSKMTNLYCTSTRRGVH